MIRIVVIDDHLLVGEGIRALLPPHIEVVGVFTTPPQDVSFLLALHPDVILLDINLNITNGLDLCKAWLRLYPSLKIIGLSMHHEYRYLSGMQKAGAKGYLLKNANQAQIIEAIEKVMQGDTYFTEEVAAILASGAAQASTIDLNPKERKILQEVIEGKTSRQIAENLNVGIKTVEFYRNSLLVKFNVRNSIELGNKARKMDLL